MLRPLADFKLGIIVAVRASTAHPVENGRETDELLDRVSVPSRIAVDILMVCNGEGQSSHVLVFCVNFYWQESIACI